MNQIIYLVIQLVLMIIAYVLGKYVTPKLVTNKTIAVLSEWAYKLVVSAKRIFEDGEGEVKREYVTKAIKAICKKCNISLTEEQIRALIEDAYELMKQTEKENKE